VTPLPIPGRAVTICEVLLRDGIQGWPHFIDTKDKTRLLHAIVDAGVSEIDATSFVSLKLVPQMADGQAVLEAVPDSVCVRVLAVNMKGVDSAIRIHRTTRRIERCGTPFSVSESHNRANLRRGHAEQKIVLADMFAALVEAGIAPLLGVVTAFGCPLEGRVDPEAALAIAHWGYDLGVRAIMFGDTTGMANPVAVANLFGLAAKRFPEAALIAHFHDNRGIGIANAIAAIGAGATIVDACLGGMGGEPAAIELGLTGDQGNITTEDLVSAFHIMGVQTGIDPEAILRAGALAEAIIGRPLFSKVQRSGLAMIV
jgi:hydroxymethylglutaryl-CoA lyase